MPATLDPCSPTTRIRSAWAAGQPSLASVGYRRDKWEYQLNAENLLNRRRYFTGSDYQNQVYPGAPINVFATIRLRFN